MKKYLIVLFFLLSIFLIMTEPLIDLKGRNEIILNLNDKYVEHGSIKELFLEQKLDVDNICRRVSKMLKE